MDTWTRLDPYTRREKLEREATVKWESKLWSLVETVDGQFFVLDRRFDWSSSVSRVWADGSLVRFQDGSLPAFVRKVCAQFVKVERVAA